MEQCCGVNMVGVFYLGRETDAGAVDGCNFIYFSIVMIEDTD